MRHYDSIDRTASLQRLCPDLYDYENILYIGARSNRFDYGLEFRAAGYNIDVLEVFPENVRHLKTIPWINNVIEGDVREISFWNDYYDVVFWWHGPEHIHSNELIPTLNKLEIYARKLIVLGCPWGTYVQGAIHNNPWEEHVGAYSWEHFEPLGYEVECLGQKDVPGSNVTAVKRL